MYTILERKNLPRIAEELPKVIFNVLADNDTDKSAFIADYPNAAPGTSIVVLSDEGIETKYVKQNDSDYVALSGSGGGGGGGLPDVTAEDNGDVLTVVNGAWDKAEPSSGPQTDFAVTYTIEYDENDNTVVTCNKTYSELLALLDGGYGPKLAAVTIIDDGYEESPLVYDVGRSGDKISFQPTPAAIYFFFMYNGGGSHARLKNVIRYFTNNSDESVALELFEFEIEPLN